MRFFSNSTTDEPTGAIINETVARSDGQLVNVYDVATGTEVNKFPVNHGAGKIATAGRDLAVTNGNLVTLIDMVTGEIQWKTSLSTYDYTEPQSIAIGTDSVVSLNGSSANFILERSDGTVRNSFLPYESSVPSNDLFISDGKYTYSDSSNRILVRDVADGEILAEDTANEVANTPDRDPDGKRFTQVYGNNQFRVYSDLSLTEEFTANFNDLFSKDAYYIFSTATDGDIVYLGAFSTGNYDGIYGYDIAADEVVLEANSFTADGQSIVNHIRLNRDENTAWVQWFDTDKRKSFLNKLSLDDGSVLYEIVSSQDSMIDMDGIEGIARKQSGVSFHGNESHSEKYVYDAEGTQRRVWVIPNGADDPAKAKDEDLIFEEKA